MLAVTTLGTMYKPLADADLDSVVLRRDLIASGFNDRQIRSMVRSGELLKVRHGAYVPPSILADLSPEDHHRILARAVLRTHKDAVLSHVSAAVEMGAPTWRIDLGHVHITRVDGSPARREAGVVTHCGKLDPAQVLELRGVLVTEGTRAALDVMTIATIESALVTVNGLLHQRATTKKDLEDGLSRLEHWPHSRGARIVLALADPSMGSVGESRLFHLCWRAGLPTPMTQWPVFDPELDLRAWVDFAWPDHGVFMEFDGRDKYFRYRREGESLEQYILREKRREELICQVTGWVCIRVTWQDLENPVRTAHRIRALLASRSRSASNPRTAVI